MHATADRLDVATGEIAGRALPKVPENCGTALLRQPWPDPVHRLMSKGVEEFLVIRIPTIGQHLVESDLIALEFPGSPLITLSG